MDLFRKLLGLDEKESEPKPKIEIKEDKFFRMFKNQEEMNKHFQEQIEEMLRMLEGQDLDDVHDDFFKQNPELKKHLEEYSRDNDLDDLARSEKINTLLDQIVPEKSRKSSEMKPEKRTDDQKVMDIIHGTSVPDALLPKRPRSMSPFPNRSNIQSGVPPNGIFDNNVPRISGQFIISQTIRKPDGSYETKKTIRDANGEVQTTITRSHNGHIEQITTYGEDKGNANAIKRHKNESNEEPMITLDRNTYLNKEGYIMPRNLF